MNKTRNFTFLALLTAFAVLLSLFENIIPLPIAAPGAKLGLPNMIILSSLVVFGFKKSLTINIVRTFLVLIIIGNPISFIYSFFGAVFSIIAMYIVHRHFSNYFSLIGVSIFGALAHNTAQVVTASIILENLNILSYLPVMYLISLFTGFFVGYSSNFIVKQLNKVLYKTEWR
jgi:heptaprenyl diphosphate synthase